jgi:hypothetical protein
VQKNIKPTKYGPGWKKKKKKEEEQEETNHWPSHRIRQGGITEESRCAPTGKYKRKEG